MLQCCYRSRRSILQSLVRKCETPSWNFQETPEDSESEDQGKSAQLKLGPKRSFSAPALVAKPAPAEAEIRDRSATWGLPGDRVLMPNETIGI